jgi:hypothetical protein
VAIRCSISWLVLLALAMSAPLGAHAEPPPTKDWEVEVLPYLWGPSIDGSIETPSGGTEHFDVSLSDILEDLELGAMARVNARWKRWLLVVDGLWTKLEQDDSVQRQRVRIDTDLELQMAMAQALAGARIFARPGGLLGTALPGDERVFGIDVLAGANYVYLSAEVELDVDPTGPILPGRERDFDTSESWFAPVVGLRIQNDFTTRLRFETLASLGGFGVGSAPDLSWQLTTLLSYRFTDHWLVSVGHRLFAADDDQYDVQMHGAMLGIGCRF